MRRLALPALLSALATAALVGCSTHPTASSSRSEAAPIDLGSFAVPDRPSDNEPRHYELGGGRYCLLRLMPLASGQVLVEAPVVQRDPRGNPRGDKLAGRPRTLAWPGERVTLPFDGGQLTLALKAGAIPPPVYSARHSTRGGLDVKASAGDKLMRDTLLDGETATLTFDNHTLTVKTDQVLLDGKVQARIPPSARSLQVTCTKHEILLLVDNQRVLRVRYE